MLRVNTNTGGAPELDGSGLHIGVVVSRFNADICDALRDACVHELEHLGAAATVVSVPGALEIPLVAQTMGQSGNFDALIALGAVIRGETYHFEVVSNEASRGVMAVQLDTGIPVANGILTCFTDAQAHVRVRQKAEDCARAAVEMANLLIAMTGRTTRHDIAPPGPPPQARRAVTAEEI
ncbi:6,7-dimethyl-8-ribityllumazine synthase [Nitrogeniibacter aestuarii]|uniref:6,7-dimethyl-8-ribityllumazine synthase n=1 Tax=Nitrogeniibacter aestuarii TaxID=2815343 RepID=UPI001E3B7917|nr:6,7-dimethyl-8-ribityllumazine synthase [Nitrogeniibacter aestuarii]